MGKKQEKELAFRKRLISELDKSKNNIKNSLEHVSEKEYKGDSKTIRKVLDEIEMFSNEIDLSESGHKYSYFDPKRSIKGEDLEKINEFNQDILERCKDLTEASEEIEQKLVEDEDFDVVKEFSSVRNHITSVRNKYKDRLDYIKGIDLD